MECGKRRGIFGKNYAGLDVRGVIRDSNTFGFPERHSDLTLPGSPPQDFLCAKCANKRNVVCSVHGPIKDKFSMGYPPLCIACQKEDDEMKSHPHVHEVQSINGIKHDFMRYVDSKHNFLIDIPKGWKPQPLKRGFGSTGGRVAFQTSDGQAIVNVSVGKLDRSEWTDQSLRKAAMIDFLRRAQRRHEDNWLEDMSTIQLGGEKNTVGFIHKNPQGYGTIVSAYHNGLEYVIQAQDNRGKEYETIIRNIITSFEYR